MASYTLQATATGLWDVDRPTTAISSEATAKMSPRTMLFKFDSVPSAMQYKEILSVEASFWLKPGAAGGEIGYIRGKLRPVLEAWNPTTLTARNRPASAALSDSDWETAYAHVEAGERVSGVVSKFKAYLQDKNKNRSPAVDVLRNGLEFSPDILFQYDGRLIATHLDAEKPTLDVEYGETVSLTPGSMSPTGYVPKNKSCTFRWSVEKTGYCPGDLMAASTSFRWRPAGGSWTSVNCGTDTSYTLAASSVTADTIEWQVVITDSNGTTTSSATRAISTVEALSEAVAVSPAAIMVDGTADNVFRWQHIISTGTAPTASELQVSTDGSTWTALASVSGSELSTTVPGGTLSGGSQQWRVRTFNTDNAAGEWSAPVSIMVIAAPATPAVSAEQTPRPLISWQSTGQQGYQMRIPGVWESGSVYGTEQSRKIPVILSDGSYTVEVRVVNEYGLWSAWGSAPLTVSNSAGAAITLIATAAADIILSWSSSGSYARYLVERDGEPAALTAETTWTDVRAAGEHTYRVYGITEGSDDYGVSDPVTVTLTVESNSITDLLSGQRLDMPYSTTQIQEEQIQISREMELTHFAGAPYPSAEIGEGRERSVAFAAAFRDLGEGKRLEALVGRLVCLKAKNNESVVGVLAQLRKTSSVFWVDYEGEISQVDDREEVEL